MASPDGIRLPVITGEKGAFWCTMTVRGTPGTRRNRFGPTTPW